MKYENVKIVFLAFVFAVYFFWLLPEASAMLPINQNSDSKISKNINFSGYEWDIKTGRHAPGTNNWSRDNCWVDENGYLHLKITKVKDQWYSAEVSTKLLFNYGLYQFEVIGPVDRLDPNVVLGLFVYSEKSEIDIEFAKWGKRNAPSGNFTVVPTTTWSFPVSLEGCYTLQQFDWGKKQVGFSSYHGHMPDKQMLITYKQFSLAKEVKSIPTPPVKVHINLWLFKGNAPTDNQEVEIIIKAFNHTAS